MIENPLHKLCVRINVYPVLDMANTRLDSTSFEGHTAVKLSDYLFSKLRNDRTMNIMYSKPRGNI